MATPVLIVAGNSLLDTIYKALQKLPFFVCNMKQLAVENFETTIKEQYLTKDSNGCYGVYLLNETLAIGTDIPNSIEIDQQGGSLLILADIFAKRIEEQA
jgi:hypothetical protein